MRTSAIALSALASLGVLHLCPGAAAEPILVGEAEDAPASPSLPVAVAPPETAPPETALSATVLPATARPAAIPSATVLPAIAKPHVAALPSMPVAMASPQSDPPERISPERIALEQPLPERMPGGMAPALIAEPESVTAAIAPEDVKAELGEIRILPPSKRPTSGQSAPQQPDVQLLLRSSVFTSDNVTALEAFRRGDTVFYNSAYLLATPKLGETTRLVATVGGGLVRYADRDESNYNLVSWSLGVQQRLSSGMYAQLGGGQDYLYRAESGSRLLRDTGLNFILGRQDQLGKRLRLDSAYNLRASFTNLETQSQVSHTLGTRLRYDITPSFQGAIDYRLTFKDFTEVARFDTEHQVGASLTYAINPKLFVAGTVSYLFGRSSNVTADLDNFSVGISVGLNVPLF
jgi:hypothetical protein